ncbi:heme exporter protein CcmD [Azohydromonas aeria]|uniref:heme exporter protein CcmD n=1 Tax=Azohydromonas aeria TaxID=2590212 RepID=UPI0018E0158D|nr:heme exporter protein CcmD [Azohydromonas aeria]
MSGIDWALFWHMGGHGLYVWGGWGGAALALGVEFFVLWRRARRLPAPRSFAGPRGRVFSPRVSEALPGRDAQERP